MPVVTADPQGGSCQTQFTSEQVFVEKAEKVV